MLQFAIKLNIIIYVKWHFYGTVEYSPFGSRGGPLAQSTFVPSVKRIVEIQRKSTGNNGKWNSGHSTRANSDQAKSGK
jgi:hypothetical protein